MWQTLKIYGSWIEPVIINNWVAMMQSMPLNQRRAITREQYDEHLSWGTLSHDTRLVRNRVQEMVKQDYRLQSVWSGSKLAKEYHVDHCIPFAIWPNNDLWNLLPTTVKENLSKGDKIPSRDKLASSRARVLDWWTSAWGEQDMQMFMTQAQMVLPGLRENNDSFDDVFEAMTVQVRGVRDRMAAVEW